jgi:hypothetical protein
MKRNTLFALIVTLLMFGAGCKIVDPVIIALNLPLEVCASLNSGNAWNETQTYNIHDEIAKVSTDYPDKVKATRVSDITVYMPNPPSSGTGSGTITYALNGGSPTTLASFTNVPFDSLKAPGVSLVHTSLISYNAPALLALLTALQDTTGLPSTTTITIQTTGATTVTVPKSTEVCAQIHYQVDVTP